MLSRSNCSAMFRALRRQTVWISACRISAWLICAGLVLAVLVAGTPALADGPEGTVSQNSFTSSSFSINEGTSLPGSGVTLQLQVNPGNASGFAGTTTHRFTSNTVTFSASGSVQGSVNSTDPSTTSNVQNFASGGLTYNTPGNYNVSFGNNVSWIHSANGSFNGFGTSNYSVTHASAQANNLNITVNNLAPHIVTANLNGTNGTITVNEGSTVAMNMTGSDPGTETVNFNVNGNASNVFGTAGTTRTSGSFNETFNQNGAFNRSFTMKDEFGADADNTPQTRTVSVLNVAPTITALRENGTVVPNTGGITVNEGSTVTLNMSATDPGADTVTFNVNGNSSTDLNTTPGSTRNSGTTSVTYNNNGTFTNNFNAKDSDGANASNGPQSANVTVLNVAPQNLALNLSSHVINEGQSITANMTATDPGSDSLSFTINSNSAGTDSSGIPGSTRTSSTIGLGPFTEHAGGTQTYTIAGSVFDGDGTSSTSTLLTVLNVAPTILTMAAVDVANPLGNACLHYFTATAFDPGLSDNLTFWWDVNNTNSYVSYGATNNGGGNWSSTTPTFPYTLGTHTVNLYVTDDDTGVSAISHLTFTCTPEPATWLVMALAGGAMAFMTRKRRKRA